MPDFIRSFVLSITLFSSSFFHASRLRVTAFITDDSYPLSSFYMCAPRCLCGAGIHHAVTAKHREVDSSPSPSLRVFYHGAKSMHAHKYSDIKYGFFVWFSGVLGSGSPLSYAVNDQRGDIWFMRTSLVPLFSVPFVRISLFFLRLRVCIQYTFTLHSPSVL